MFYTTGGIRHVGTARRAPMTYQSETDNYNVMIDRDNATPNLPKYVKVTHIDNVINTCNLNNLSTVGIKAIDKDFYLYLVALIH